jgi:hypothetical protein
MKYILALTLFVASCATGPRIKDGVLDCAKGQASAALPDLRMLIDLVSMGGDWKPALEAMERLHTSELVTCIVQRIIFDLQTSRAALSPDDALKLTRLQAWIANRPYKVK